MEAPVTKTDTTSGPGEQEKRDTNTIKHLCKHISGGTEPGEREEKAESSYTQPHRVQLPAKLQRKSLQRQVHKEGSAPTNCKSTWEKVSSYLPPALATQKPGVYTKPGVTTASADNKMGMRNHPVSPSTDYTGATDYGFRLGAHPVIAKDRGGKKTDVTSTCLCDNRMLQAS